MTLNDYTEEQILAMEAGSVINALIATEVMGWESSPTDAVWMVKTNSGTYAAVGGKDWYDPSEYITQAYEAEEQVPEDQRTSYVDCLIGLIEDYPGSDDDWQIAHATPLQRCKALLIWKKRSTQ